MSIPDKLSKDMAAGLCKNKNGYSVVVSDDNGVKKDRVYKLPKWLSEEIDFHIECARRDGASSKLYEIRKALNVN